MKRYLRASKDDVTWQVMESEGENDGYYAESKFGKAWIEPEYATVRGRDILMSYGITCRAKYSSVPDEEYAVFIDDFDSKQEAIAAAKSRVLERFEAFRDAMNDRIEVHYIKEGAYASLYADYVTVNQLLDLIEEKAKSIEGDSSTANYVVIQRSSTISGTYFDSAIFTDSKAEAVAEYNNWLDANGHGRARDSLSQVHYYASVVDLNTPVEVQFGDAWGNYDSDN